MNIRPDLVVTVRHYSLINVFKSIIASVVDQIITLKLPKEFARSCFMEGDPVVIAYEVEEDVKIVGGIVTRLNLQEETLELRVDAPGPEVVDRLYERFPISCYADFRLKDNHKKLFALVKDISYYGMRIFTKEDMFLGYKMDIDIFLDRNILSLKCEVVRKEQMPPYFDYGLRLLHNGPLTYNQVKSYVSKSQDEHISRFNRE